MTRDWPHPDSLLTLTKTAPILGVSRWTLARNIAEIRADGRPSSPRPDVRAVAKLFSDRLEGSAARIPARELMIACGDDPALFESASPPPPPPPPAKERRLRITSKERALWRRLPPRELAERMRDAWLGMTDKETKNAKRRVLEIAEIMQRRGVEIEEKWITPESVVVFATMAAWAARATARVVWPFLLVGPSRRPVDLLSARPREMSSGELVLLTPREYADALSKALNSEYLECEQVELETVAEKAQLPARQKGLRSKGTS